MVIIQSIGTWLRRSQRIAAAARVQRIASEISGACVSVPALPRRFSVDPLKKWFVKRAIQRLARGRRCILEGNGAEATTLCLEAFEGMGHPIVYRCWGLEEEEALMAEQVGGEGLKENSFDRLRRIQSHAFKRSSLVVCVSNAMRSYLHGKFGTSRGLVEVVPCGVGTCSVDGSEPDVHREREKLGISKSAFVLVYCGGMQAYQLIEPSIILAKRLLASGIETHFLAITKDSSRMVELLQALSFPLDKSSIVTCAHKEVASYLRVGDAGMLLRALSPVNFVSSPVKFGEYLAAGLPVFISPQVGDYSQNVAQFDIGVVLDDDASSDDSFDRVVRFIERQKSKETRNELSQRIKKFIPQLDIETASQSVLNLYSDLLRQKF